MTRLPVVVVGAGHCGLAMSRHLAARSIDHVVLERGEVANSWRTERGDSLRLLTPNWLSRLPGHAYDGADPDGYMTAGDVAGFIQGYADASEAPVRTNTTVESVAAAADGGYRVRTDDGEWTADAVVVASGACNLAKVPAVAESLPAGITSMSTLEYRNPEQVPEGGVLVVGAAASGIQIADELISAGRRVTISTGEHVRMPRRPSATRPPGSRRRPRSRSTWPAAKSGRSSGPPATRPTSRGSRSPVLNSRGRLVHDGGLTKFPGLYLMGMPFLRRRKSTLIDGARADTADLFPHLVEHLDAVAANGAAPRRFVRDAGEPATL